MSMYNRLEQQEKRLLRQIYNPKWKNVKHLHLVLLKVQETKNQIHNTLYNRSQDDLIDFRKEDGETM